MNEKGNVNAKVRDAMKAKAMKDLQAVIPGATVGEKGLQVLAGVDARTGAEVYFIINVTVTDKLTVTKTAKTAKEVEVIEIPNLFE